MKKILLALTLFITIFSTSSFVGYISDNENKSAMIDSIDSNYNKLPECVRVFDYVVKYAKKYSVPFNIAFGIIHTETGYKGPLHMDYNPRLTSKSKAYGAMQIKLKTANTISDKVLTKKDLLSNTELNIELGLKLLSSLKDQYGSWKLALGAYNTGKPVVNQYAKNIIKFKADKYFIWDTNKG